METTLHPTPSAGIVLREQVAAVGLALRTPALAATGLMALATAAAVANLAFQGGGPVDFHPDRWMIPGIVALLLPIGIWKGDAHYGTGFLWTLPVDRRWNALARVLAGWGWLMAGVALFVTWLLALTLLSGGSLFPRETILLAPEALPGAVDLASLRSVPWRTTPLLWLAPFTGATGAYLVSSALALATRHPVRWIVGAVLSVLLLNLVGVVTRSDWLADLPLSVLSWLYGGPYGLDALLTGRTESLKTETFLTTGEFVVVWRGLPELRHWAIATVAWIALGLAAVAAAASRHRERRRA